MSPNQTLRSPSFRLAALFLVLAAGCAAPPPKQPAEVTAAFYPALPDPPRIQYLATFSGAQDFAGERSAMAEFVLGKEKTGEALRQPYGAVVHQGKIYVADSRGPGIAVFDLAARRFSFLDGSPGGRMQRPINIRIDADGRKYVTDTGRNQVIVFGPDDRFVAAFGEKGEFKPVDAVVAGDRLYVADIEHHEVHVLDKRSGRRLFKFGKAGSAEGELFHPTNLAIGPDGHLYVVETGNFRVSRFTPDGKFVRRYGQAGQAPGQFARPKGIAVDRAGRLLVGDAAFQNVQIFDGEGRVLMSFGQPEGAMTGLNLPAGVSIDYDNVPLFRPYADPKFSVEYVILVVSQFGPNKVDVFGFGRMAGVRYPADDPPAAGPAR